jgi:hypothetical protein
MAKAKVDVEKLEGATEEVAKPKMIKDYPRISCVVESRDEQEVDLPIGINEYQAYIQFGKEVELPEPVYNMIKDITTIRFEKDENGFTKSKEIKKYIISKV